MSIIRVGLAETKRFAEGWEAIFGKPNSSKAKKSAGRTRGAKTKKKPARKKK